MIMQTSPLVIVVAVILAPVIEEYIFRKQIIDHARKYGEGTAIFLSALTFALFHMDLYQFFYAFGLGLIFAYIYTRTGQLRYSVMLHAIINFLGTVATPLILSLADGKVPPTSTSAASVQTFLSAYRGIIGMLAAGLYSFLILGLIIAGSVLLNNNRKRLVLYPADEELVKGRRVAAVYWNPGMVLYILLCLGMTAYTLFAQK